MRAYNICNCILILIIIIGVFYIANSEENFYYRRRRGQWMDAACGKFDCSTPEGAQQAVADCKSSLMKDPLYNLVYKKACEHPDPEIRAMGCPDLCQVEDVYSFFLEGEKGKLLATTCKQPEELGMDQEGSIYCKNSYGDWIMKKTKKQIDAEEAAKKAAEEEAKKKAEEEEKTVKPTETTVSAPIPEAPVVGQSGLKQEKFYYLN
jgi:hypothetical protein